MIRFALLLLPFTLLAADGKKADRKPASAPSVVPAGAARIAPQAWRYTDKDGKTWIYQQTPFGLMRAEEQPRKPSTEAPPPVKATDLGDSVRFEQQTPFGARTWTKSKTDLTADEKSWFEARKPSEKGSSITAKPAEK
ncbi:MAG TPA: hypothetical protein VGF59_02345 [Bryobacteraceae bacterium]|jgi:hypothetical protein